MSVLQVLQTDPTNWQSVLVEMQIDPTDFHVVLSPSRPGADRDSRSVLWVRRDGRKLGSKYTNSCLTYSFGGWHIAIGCQFQLRQEIVYFKLNWHSSRLILMVQMHSHQLRQTYCQLKRTCRRQLKRKYPTN